MLEEVYKKLDIFRENITEEKDVSILRQKEKEYGIIIPELLYDFYRHYGNDKAFLSAFYNFDDVENICIENDALVFGYTHQKIARLGIPLKKLNSEYQSVNWYSEELKGWFMEGGIFPEGFFFHMAAWHVMNLMPSMARAKASEEDFAKLTDTYFSFFNNDKIFTKGYRIIAVYYKNILGCYWREDDLLYLSAWNDADLEKAEEELGLDLDWL